MVHIVLLKFIYNFQYGRDYLFQSACRWEEKLPMSKSALESTWLYHEIGRCHLELGHFSDAKEFGDKSLEAAQEADDDVWQLNASVLVAQSLGKLRWELTWCTLH